jgi:hypothetical protein
MIDFDSLDAENTGEHRISLSHGVCLIGVF